MNADNDIYPLDEIIFEQDDPTGLRKIKRSVNQRLAPIFRALLDDPDGWEGELTSYVDWRDAHPTQIIPITHGQCDQFRLVRKRKTITVEMDEPLQVYVTGAGGNEVCIEFPDWETAARNVDAICKQWRGR